MSSSTATKGATMHVWKLLFLPFYMVALISASDSGKVVPAKHVVGAGLGRTGTLSFKTALEMFPNVGPVFHMRNSMKSPHLFPLWEELTRLAPVPTLYGNPVWPPRLSERGKSPEERNKRVELLRTILGVNQTYWQTLNNKQEKLDLVRYNSAVDFPTCIYFRDLLDVYRNDKDDERSVKVVLTVRETGIKWAESGLNAILRFIPCNRPFGIHVLFCVMPALVKAGEMLTNTFSRYFPTKASDYDLEIIGKMHDDWNDYVRSTMKTYASEKGIPLDEIFLEYQVKQGWEPLCKFLGYHGDECPADQPFPHVNDKEFHRKKWLKDNILGYGLAVAIATCVAGTLWAIRFVVTWIVSPHRKNKKKKMV